MGSTRSGRPGASGPLLQRRHQGGLRGPGSGAADGADGDSSTHRPQTGRKMQFSHLIIQSHVQM